MNNFLENTTRVFHGFLNIYHHCKNFEPYNGEVFDGKCLLDGDECKRNGFSHTFRYGGGIKNKCKKVSVSAQI